MPVVTLSRSRLLLSLLLVATAALSACNRGPSATVDGDRFTEDDLRRHRPKVYWELRKEFDAKMAQALQQLAIDRLLELEAKEKGISSGKDYLTAIRSQAPRPTEAEIQDTYNALRASGRISNESFGAIRGQIESALHNQAMDRQVQLEISRLQEKYHFAQADATYPEEADQPVQVAVERDDPARLNLQAKVTVIEFSDFECPFCARAQEITRKVREAYGNRIRWVVKDFPLHFHPHAMGAHIAAHCVLRQDQEKYWRFFDTIFAPDRPANILQPDSLRRAAAAQGVNVSDYDQCLRDPTVEQRIRKNMQAGEEAGVSGTPSFFINGHQIEGAMPFEEFKRLIDRELEKAGG
ncbi:MAG: thioredoxin domain-containing protein [Leptospirales bacterium]|nr:thioredoxin domain-containing protein [Leptospirales bacterium]